MSVLARITEHPVQGLNALPSPNWRQLYVRPPDCAYTSSELNLAQITLDMSFTGPVTSLSGRDDTQAESDLSRKDRKVLEACCATVTLQRVKRARIVLLAADGRSTGRSPRKLGSSRGLSLGGIAMPTMALKG